MRLQVVGHFVLQVVAALRPVVEKPVQRLDVHEEVLGLALDRRLAADRTDRVDQVDRAVRGSAAVAVVSILVRRTALGIGARSLDEAIGQRLARLAVEQLDHLPLADQLFGQQRTPDLFAARAVFGRVRAAVVVEDDVAAGEVALMRLVHLGDECLFAAAALPGALHDGRAVGVVGTDVDATVAAQLLKADPNVGLDVLDQVAEVNRTVRVGQRGGHQDSSRIRHAGKAPGGKRRIRGPTCHLQPRRTARGQKANCIPRAEISGVADVRRRSLPQSRGCSREKTQRY